MGVTASEYDPWLDNNDDGKIDIFDVVKVAGAYGTNGTPLNKTFLLLDLLERVETLENQSGWLPPPAYDSGWIDWEPSDVVLLQHDLNTTNIFVHMLAEGDTNRTHQTYLGREIWYKGTDNQEKGAYWITGEVDPNNTIEIRRQKTDRDSSEIDWEEVRVQIWKIPQP